MNIFIVSALNVWSMGEGKGSPVLYKTLKTYADRGHKVFFLTSAKGKSKEEDIFRNVHITRFSVPLPGGLINIRKIGFMFKPIWWWLHKVIGYHRAADICRNNKIDVFYGYEIFGVPIAAKLARKNKKPMVSRFQGTILRPKTGKKFWKICFWQHVKALKTPADLVIMTDDGTKGDEILEMLGTDKDKVRFWMNGVDRNKPDAGFDGKAFKNQLGVNDDEKVLLTVTRLAGWKRVERIINAMPDIITNYSRVKLLIAGEGSERKSLEKLVGRLNMRDYIQFLGSVPQNDLWKYFSIADIFILFNDLSNLSNPLLEAMSCGKSIVTLNVGDTGKIVKNGENGVLLEYDELNTISTRIVELLNNDGFRGRLGSNAVKTARERFDTWERRMDREAVSVEDLMKET